MNYIDRITLFQSSVRSALPPVATSVGTSGGRGPRLQAPLYTITESHDDGMEVDPKEWVPDQGTAAARHWLGFILTSPQPTASLQYLRSLTRKSTGHRRARQVQATHSWIQAKSAQLPTHSHDRLLAGHPVEDAIADYDISGDEDACLHVSKFTKGGDLAFQVSSARH
jgi:hypothetical protein